LFDSKGDRIGGGRSLRLDQRRDRLANLSQVSVEAGRIGFEVMAERRTLHQIEQDGREPGRVCEGTGDAFDRGGDDLLGSVHHADEGGSDFGRRLCGVELDSQQQEESASWLEDQRSPAVQARGQALLEARW
jgi:hypothetical protein